jgi:hypothetical protein
MDDHSTPTTINREVRKATLAPKANAHDRLTVSAKNSALFQAGVWRYSGEKHDCAIEK